MRPKEFKIYAADFETTVYEGQEATEVWAAAYVELNTEEVIIRHSIKEFFADIWEKLKYHNVKLYFHNLKFDGAFILDYFMRCEKLKQAYYVPDKSQPDQVKWYEDRNMLNGQYKYLISAMGEWYDIVVKRHSHYLMIVDSFKLLPFSLKAIGESFKTQHRKLTLEYTGFRFAGCAISPEEAHYIANDVLVLKEALEIMFDRGFKKMTIGACCLAEYRKLIGLYDFKAMFPRLDEQYLDREQYGSSDADEYIRKAYRGGWCYLARGKEGKVYHDGITLDVNSLYPSVMSGISGNAYPYGKACFWKGDYIPEEAQEGFRQKTRYYFVRIRARFKIKPGMLPTIQIKNNYLYRGNEYLETSMIRVNGKYRTQVSLAGVTYTDRVTLTLTCTDWELMQKHYDLTDCEILDGCFFFALVRVFDPYIELYKKIKMESKGAERTLAKLFLNNLYGKLATSRDSSFKIASFDKEQDMLTYTTIAEYNKKPVHIAAGAAVTSYARMFTITAAQANYYGKDRPGFIYADTDSIHCDLPIEDVKGVELDDKEFLRWKHESSWTRGIFVRQKTYIEQIEGDYNITACGMGNNCKETFKRMLETGTPLTEFKIGLCIPGNLKQKRMPGGVVLYEDDFHLR